MAERKTLLARNLGPAPLAQPAQSPAPAGAFGDATGLINLGRGLMGAGDAAQGYAMAKLRSDQSEKKHLEDLEKEKNRRLAERYNLSWRADHEALVVGVRQEYNRRRDAGEFDNGGAETWLAEKMAAVRAEMDDRYGHLSGDPVFQEAVSPEFQELQWAQKFDSLRASAGSQEGQANYQARDSALGAIVTNSFKEVDPGQHGQVFAELGEKLALVNKATLSEKDRERHRRNLVNEAYAKLAGGVALRIRIPDAIIKSPHFSAEQQTAMLKLNESIRADTPFATVSDAKKAYDFYLAKKDFGSNPKDIETARRAASQLAADAPTADMASAFFADIDLKIAENKFTGNVLSNPEGTPAYTYLTSKAAQLATDTGRTQFFESFGVKGVSPTSRSAFLTSMQAWIGETLEKFNTGRANEVLENHPRLGPIATALAPQLETGIIDPATAKAYVQTAEALSREAGLPEQLYQLYPSSARRLLDDRLRNGDTDNAHILLRSIGEGFGLKSVHSLADGYFISPGKKSGPVTADTDTGVYGMVAKIVAWDLSRLESGKRLGVPQTSHSFDLVKPLLDGIKRFETNGQHITPSQMSMVRKAYETLIFTDPTSLRDVLGGSFFAPDGDYNTPKNLERALAYQAGGNPAVAAAYRELFTRAVAMQVFQPGSEATGKEEKDHIALVGRAARDLNNQMARIFKVYNAAAAPGREPVYDVVPSVFTSEGTLAFPKLGGAANQEDSSEQLSQTMRLIGFYDPRHTYDRGFLANWANNFQAMHRSAGWFLESGPNQVPEHMQIPFERAVFDSTLIENSQPEFDPLSTYNTLRFTWNKLTPPKDRQTAAALVFRDYGAFRYDPVRQDFVAMIFPGGASNDGSTPGSRALGEPQPYLFNWSDNDKKPLLRPFRLPEKHVYDLDTARRSFRALGGDSGWNPSIPPSGFTPSGFAPTQVKPSR